MFDVSVVQPILSKSFKKLRFAAKLLKLGQPSRGVAVQKIAGSSLLKQSDM